MFVVLNHGYPQRRASAEEDMVSDADNSIKEENNLDNDISETDYNEDD